MVVNFTSDMLRHLLTGENNTACCIDENNISYAQFSSLVGGVQRKLQRTGSPVIGLIAQNHAETYATIVAAWLTGKAYVPINPGYPAERIAVVLEEAQIREVFYSEPNEEVEKLQRLFPEIEFISTQALEPATPFNAYPTADKTAYILFTSGTTGKPKGVPITFGNIQAFLEGFYDLSYTLSSADRFLQMFELTFDLSVMSFTVPLCLGASFYTLPSGMIRTLGLYHILESKEITFSLMVPSAIQLLSPYLDDIELPDLRVSQFCGEALKTDMAARWAVCVPNAVIDNVYGPTEATIYCTRQQIHPTSQEASGHNGIAGIGKPMKLVQTAIFDHQTKITDNGISGELCLAGAQVTPGYLNNETQNAISFFEHEGTRYYRSGDLVQYNADGNLMYQGRLDDQVKIQGFRIELAELELAAKKIVPDSHAVAVGVKDLQDNWILAIFIQNLELEPEHFQSEMRQLLPEYMIPHQVISVEEFPMNSNGKTDRKVLRQLAAKHL